MLAPDATVRSRRFASPDGRGRLTAILNPALTDEAGRPYGQLGFLDLANDLPAARALTASARRWLLRQDAGVATVLAPMNGDAWHDYWRPGRASTGGSWREASASKRGTLPIWAPSCTERIA